MDRLEEEDPPQRWLVRDSKRRPEETDELLEEGAAKIWVRPVCPRCGWSNTRPSLNYTLGDRLLRLFHLRAFRCRSCGNRFRAVPRRVEEAG